jgi:serine/threonine protein kinase
VGIPLDSMARRWDPCGGLVTAADPCLGDDTLACFGEQSLPPNESARIRQHLDRCAACRRLLADVVAARAEPSRAVGFEPAAPTLNEPRAHLDLPRPTQPGDVIGEKYRIERVLGSGGMGSVFAATHLDLGHTIAIKLLNDGIAQMPDMVKRFMREGRAAAQLKSDHALRIFDVGRLPSGVPFLVMEYLEGEDLESLARARQPAVEEAIDWMAQAAHALTEAHALGLVHRDLKPQNLFLAKLLDGQSRIKVVDFGLVKDLSRVGVAATAGATSENMMLGSPLYMSPEQIRSASAVDARCDVWALGATLFRLLAGRPPFKAKASTALLTQILSDPIPSLRALRADVPEGVERAIERALAKPVEARFPDVQSFVHALRSAVSPSAPHTLPDPVPHTVPDRVPTTVSEPIVPISARAVASTEPAAMPLAVPMATLVETRPPTFGETATFSSASPIGRHMGYATLQTNMAAKASPPPRDRMPTWAFVLGVVVLLILPGIVGYTLVGKLSTKPKSPNIPASTTDER